MTGKKLIILGGVVGVSFSSILVKITTAPSMVLVFYRMLFTSLMLTIPCVLQMRKEENVIRLKEILLCAASGFFLALHFTTYFSSLDYTSVASSVLLVDTEVFFVAFIMVIFFHEKISKWGWIGIVCTFIGSAVVGMADASGGSDVLRGDLLALLGAFLMAVYTIIGKICRRTMSTTAYTTLVYWAAAITSGVLLFVQKTPIVGYEGTDYLSAFGMAVLCTLLGHSIFSWGLKYVSTAYVSTIKMASPIFSSIFAYAFFREVPGVMIVVGGAIIIFGIIVYSKNS